MYAEMQLVLLHCHSKWSKFVECTIFIQKNVYINPKDLLAVI